MNPLIIKIGDTGKGGWWYAIDQEHAFADGFATEAAATKAAKEYAGTTPYEIWYRCEMPEGRAVTIPGAKSANHPDLAE